MLDAELIAARVRDSIFVRPLAFVAGGLVLGAAALAVDAVAPPPPPWLRFDLESARLLYGTLAGAMLTVAGITFWVRAAAVQLAAGQYSPRVVHGFLQDWFQQSMMGLLVGIFAYIVVVFRAIPVGDPDVAGPQWALLFGVAAAGGSVLAILGAIRNGVQSMQAGQLARRITDVTVARIRATHREPGVVEEEPEAEVPLGGGHIVRSVRSGYVQRVRSEALLAALPPGAVVRLEVRVGLFVLPGRPLCTVWSEAEPDAYGSEARRAFRLGRTRVLADDIDYGVRQLVDVAVGSLSHGAGDASSAREVIVHLEMLLRELVMRDVPATVVVDDEGRTLLHSREYRFDDYVRDAFERLRQVAAPHPEAAKALLTTLGALVRDAHRAGRPARATPLRRQARLTLASCEHAGLLDDDLHAVRSVADRWGLLPAGGE